MKKFILVTTLIMMILGISNTMSIYADEVSKRIKINETNFPNKFLREKVKDKVDKNNDNILQESEINDVKEFSLSLESYYLSYYNDTDLELKENYHILNCKGLEYFKNIEELYLDVSRYEYGSDKRGYVNFNNIYQLKELRKLTITGDNIVKKWYFNRFPKLKELKLEGIVKVKKIKFGKKLKNLTMSSIRGKEKLDLSKAKELEKFVAQGVHLKGIKFGKNKNLKKIDIWSIAEGGIKSIKKIDVSGLKNLRMLQITDCPNLIKVKFGKNKKLSIVSIDAGKKLKELDFKGCRISKEILLTEGIKIKNLWSGYRGRINYYDCD